MKVLFLTGVFPNEQNPYSGVFVYNQVKALKEQGIDVCVLYFDLRSIRRKRKWGLSKYRYKEVEVYQFAIPCGPIQWLYYFLINKFTTYAFHKVQIREGLFTLVHAHFYDMGLAARRIYEKYKVPYILTEHASALLRNELKEAEKEHIRQAYQKAEFILAVGNSLKEKMKAFTDKEVIVLPNILPTRFYCDPPINKNSANFHYVSVVGNLIPTKRVDLVVKAFINLSKYNENIYLTICGEGILMDELRQFVKEKKLEDKIKFLGVIDNSKLPDLLRSCDCFVLPSVMETFGVVYIEAAGCGLPIIAAESGGAYDIVNKENGIIVKNNDLEDLIKAMAYIYDNYKQYNSVMISEHVKEKFGEKAFCNTIMNIYQKMER